MITSTGTVPDLQALPEGCLANIISLTTPRDACRLSSVSKFFRSAAESDVVWDKFLPPDVYMILLRSELMQQQSSPSPSWIKTKKRFYLFLCDNPISCNDRVLSSSGHLQFSLDKRSGKKCYMIPARALKILGSGTPQLWRWISLPDSRFEEVAELVSDLWLQISGEIITYILSPSSLYKAYLVFKLTERAYGFKSHPVKVKVAKYYGLTPTTVGVEAKVQTMFLDRSKRRSYWHRIFYMQESQPDEIDEARYPTERMGGWLEIELGEFSCERDMELLEMSCVEDSFDNFKSGLIVGGIEIRPHFGERPNPRQKRQFSWGRFWKKTQSYSSLVLFSVTLLMVVLQQHSLVVVLFALSVFSSYYEKLASN